MAVKKSDFGEQTRFVDEPPLKKGEGVASGGQKPRGPGRYRRF